MNRDDIIRMAREAGLLVIGTADGSDAVYTWPQGITDELERFAALVAASEREACAKLAEKTVCDTHIPTGVKIYGSRAADAILARSNT